MEPACDAAVAEVLKELDGGTAAVATFGLATQVEAQDLARAALARLRAHDAAAQEALRGEVARLVDALVAQEDGLRRGLSALDRMVATTNVAARRLALYVAAGEAKLRELDAQAIPAKAAEAAAASEPDGVLRAQELRDLRSLRDDLERRVHDLRLTRQITMQSLPSIRLVQENDKGLVTRTNSTLVNTVPLWEAQLAQALAGNGKGA